MHIGQKAGLYNRTDFTFGDKELEFSVDDGRNKYSFSSPYHTIGKQRLLKSFSEKAYKRYGITLIVAVLIALGAQLFGPLAPQTDDMLYQTIFCAGLFCLGIILLIWSGFSSFDVIQIPVASGNTLLIFPDGNQSRILGEIHKRRKQELYRLNAEVDALNHPAYELKKFTWLKEEDVISEQEFEEAYRKILQMQESH